MAGLTSYRGIHALVTGASSGFGRVLALRFASAGARVSLVARREERLRQVAEEIAARGGEARVAPCDVGVQREVEAAAERARSAFGPVDLLLNNAGYARHESFRDWDVADMERMMRVNYFGSVYWAKAVLPAMLERRRGWLVFMASAAGKLGIPGESAYSATKFALVGLAEAISLELEDEGVHVLTVCPGAFRTDLFAGEALDRMPPIARRMARDAEDLVEPIVRALAAGKRELLYPRSIAWAQRIRGLAPGFVRAMLKRSTVDALRSRGAPTFDE